MQHHFVELLVAYVFHDFLISLQLNKLQNKSATIEDSTTFHHTHLMLTLVDIVVRYMSLGRYMKMIFHLLSNA
jgi:hypothetical protein